MWHVARAPFLPFQDEASVRNVPREASWRLLDKQHVVNVRQGTTSHLQVTTHAWRVIQELLQLFLAEGSVRRVPSARSLHRKGSRRAQAAFQAPFRRCLRKADVSNVTLVALAVRTLALPVNHVPLGPSQLPPDRSHVSHVILAATSFLQEMTLA